MPGSTARMRLTPDHQANALFALDELGAAALALRALDAPEHRRAALFVARAAIRTAEEAASRLGALALHLDGWEVE